MFFIRKVILSKVEYDRLVRAASHTDKEIKEDSNQLVNTGKGENSESDLSVNQTEDQSSVELVSNLGQDFSEEETPIESSDSCEPLPHVDKEEILENEPVNILPKQSVNNSEPVANQQRLQLDDSIVVQKVRNRFKFRARQRISVTWRIKIALGSL